MGFSQNWNFLFKKFIQNIRLNFLIELFIYKPNVKKQINRIFSCSFFKKPIFLPAQNTWYVIHTKSIYIMVKSTAILYALIPISLFFSALSSNSFLENKHVNDNGLVESKIVGDSKEEVWGLDISHHQESINWSTLAEKNKPNFIIFKATEGTFLIDSRYSEYYDHAKKLDIVVGSYHFFSYRTPAKTQAENYFKVAKHNKGDMIPILDVEYRRHMPSKAVIIKEIKVFCNAVYKKYKVKPILYCNHNYYYKYLANDFKDYKFWIADYQKTPRVEWVLWQHTEKAKVHGINENVDRNILNPKHKLSDFIMN